MAVVLTILMFSLAGIPPLAGFFAKYFVFMAAIEAKLYALAIIAFSPPLSVLTICASSS